MWPEWKEKQKGPVSPVTLEIFIFFLGGGEVLDMRLRLNKGKSCA